MLSVPGAEVNVSAIIANNLPLVKTTLGHPVVVSNPQSCITSSRKSVGCIWLGGLAQNYDRR
ncbi:MAG: hypothetical protein IPQ06_15400 [Chitinophagaceae bacterium]|nr:hypothetical protein [Chitinophagaceae bacterium]